MIRDDINTYQIHNNAWYAYLVIQSRRAQVISHFFFVQRWSNWHGPVMVVVSTFMCVSLKKESFSREKLVGKCKKESLSSAKCK